MPSGQRHQHRRVVPWEERRGGRGQEQQAPIVLLLSPPAGHGCAVRRQVDMGHGCGTAASSIEARIFLGQTPVHRITTSPIRGSWPLAHLSFAMGPGQSVERTDCSLRLKGVSHPRPTLATPVHPAMSEAAAGVGNGRDLQVASNAIAVCC